MLVRLGFWLEDEKPPGPDQLQLVAPDADALRPRVAPTQIGLGDALADTPVGAVLTVRAALPLVAEPQVPEATAR